MTGELLSDGGRVSRGGRRHFERALPLHADKISAKTRSPRSRRMTNPYARKGPESFWKQAVATPPFREVAPIPTKRFRLGPEDAIATAGSCFAQNVATFLKKRGGVRLLEAEPIGPDQPAFSALYGNIYTARQLVQLVRESLGERRPADIVWRRTDGRFVDALRPTIFAAGFADAAQALVERRKHLEAVRSLLSKCTVFVFTLGL